MILNLKFVNPTNDDEQELNIKYPLVDASYYSRIRKFYNDADICNILEDLLYSLDCTKVTKIGRVCTTNSFIYEDKLSSYYYYILHISNQILYNQYINKLIKRHIDNLIFETNYVPANVVTTVTKYKGHRKASNKYIKHTTKDLITGETIYCYGNDRKGKEIKSTNPNLLNKLNSKKKKHIGVSMDAMTWNFKLSFKKK